MNCTEMTSKRRAHVRIDDKKKWGRWENGEEIWEKIKRAERREGEERSDEEGPQKLLSTKQKE